MTDDITELLKEIRELRLEIKETNRRVTTHIDFVERVFNVVRIPFFRLMSIVSYDKHYMDIEQVSDLIPIDCDDLS
jgi:hypothetical protein